MMTFIRPRLRKPLGNALAGTVLAAAWAVRGGPAWPLSIAIEVTILVRAVTLYVQGAEDSDEGALAGSRADERQKLLAQQSWALAARVTMVAAFAGLTIAVAVRSPAWWPFAVILAVAGFGYLFGLSTYGGDQEGTADDANGADDARSPVSPSPYP
jgi:hypothetical protein